MSAAAPFRVATSVSAQTPWLTTPSDEANPRADTVQVNRVPVTTDIDGVSTNS